MCGIIGIITNKKRNLVPELISSLRNLEYRGHDSTGIAVIDGNTLKRIRRVGAPSDVLEEGEVSRELGIELRPFSIGIGHNRWATHGKPSERNAHPHVDCENKIAIVHNGTILNYEILKKALMLEGHVFSSDTDTEVVAHLIEQGIKDGKSFLDAFLESITLLEGSFGLAVCSVDSPDRILIAKRGSPLSFGIGKDSLVVASSANAILPHTNTFITLEDGEYAELVSENDGVRYSIGNFVDKSIDIAKNPTVIENFSLDELSKGEYGSFMEKEVHEQPSVLRTTILGRYDTKAGDAVLGGLIDYEDKLATAKQILTVACGTAHNASQVGGVLIETLAGIPVRSEIASEFRYKKIPLSPKRVVLFAVSQSGETADTLESVKEAKRKGYETFGIVNVVGSSIAKMVDAGVYTRAGIEIGVASTKAFISQLGIFYLLALKLARERGMTAPEGQDFISELEEMPEHIQKVLQNIEEQIRDYAKKCVAQNIQTINFLGRGIHVPVSNEAALKFKELTYIEAGSYPLGELKHGPMAIIDEKTLSVVLMPKDEVFALSKNSIEQIRSKGGDLLIITDVEGAKELEGSGLNLLVIPTLKNPLFYPLIEIVPLQLFAYYYSRELGHNVDKPRNLAKSVTVE
ncbi:MAG: glutamine--fructose-6-phosphate transaminase (isomerizing) [Candidatus Pacebacteria bacterium]|nr:glutamine--fructose-6-phosphate transaminase (isomerizing) [Candidatus Paceibacterota bacterium]